MIRAVFSFAMNPSLMKISVFGASIARRPANSAVSACTVSSPSWLALRAFSRASFSMSTRQISASCGRRPAHSRDSTWSSTPLSPRSIPIASTIAMLCVVLNSGVFWPTIREIACLTRARSDVKAVAGAPKPMPATATRSDGVSLSMNALAALLIAIAPPKRMFGWSTAITIRRPPVALSLVL